MAAYRRVDDCGLTACTPGSTAGPTHGNEYGKPLPFLPFRGPLEKNMKESNNGTTESFDMQ